MGRNRSTPPSSVSVPLSPFLPLLASFSHHEFVRMSAHFRRFPLSVQRAILEATPLSLRSVITGTGEPFVPCSTAVMFPERLGKSIQLTAVQITGLRQYLFRTNARYRHISAQYPPVSSRLSFQQYIDTLSAEDKATMTVDVHAGMLFTVFFISLLSARHGCVLPLFR